MCSPNGESRKFGFIQMIAFLLITALTVSIDSFVCGFSLSFNGGKKYLVVVGIALTVFVMCLFTNYLTALFTDYLSEKTASAGGIILVGVGIYNLLKKDDQPGKPVSNLKQVLLTGFAVGLDGALANLSLSLMGLNALYVPVTIALMHALMIALGLALAQTFLAKKFGKVRFLPPLVLILLGIYKLTGLFL